jgi:magnesium transporter
MKKRVPPQTLQYIGDHPQETVIKHIQYVDDKLYVHDSIKGISDEYVDWISIEGLNDVKRIDSLCQQFKIDPLVVEDILHLNQRNKFEVHEDYVFMVLKYFYFENNDLHFNYISVVLFDNLVITFTENKNFIYETIYNRLKKQEGLVSKYDEDYLFYIIYDIIIDEGFGVYHQIKEEVNELELNVLNMDNKSQYILYRTHKNAIRLKNFLVQIDENILPSSFIHLKYFQDEINKYFEDLEDHIVNLYEKVVQAIDEINSLINLYSTTLSNKMNEIMKTLTIFSVIFIPLSFLAGVFGMNFIHFDVLQNPYGLLIFALISVATIGGMLFYFKKRNWL